MANRKNKKYDGGRTFRQIEQDAINTIEWAKASGVNEETVRRIVKANESIIRLARECIREYGDI